MSVASRRERTLREWRYGKPPNERTGVNRPYTAEQIQEANAARGRARDPKRLRTR
jgi:hypothetical protein